MKLQNISDSVVIVGNPMKYYGTLLPGQSIVLDDSMEDDMTVFSMIERGYLVKLKDGQKPAPFTLKPKPVQQHVSLIRDREVPLKGGVDSEAVSAITEGVDTMDGDPVPMNASTIKPKKPGLATPPRVPQTKHVTPGKGQEIVGQQLIKKGGKSTPANIVRTKQEIITLANGGKIIRTSSASPELGLDTGDIGSMIVGSGVPGQAQMVSIRDLNEAQLNILAEQTKKLLEDNDKQKRLLTIVNNYPAKDKEWRAQLIENTVDVDMLKVLLKIEKSGQIAVKIRSKLKKLEQ